MNIKDLAALGVTNSAIDVAMADYESNGGVWTNDGSEIHPTDFEIPTIDGPEPTSSNETNANPAYRVLGSWKDHEGKTVALRAGAFSNNKGWGYAKVSSYHNLTSRAVRAATAYTPNKHHKDGTKYEFQTKVSEVKCSGWGFWRKCKVVGSTTVITSHEARVLGDKRPRGVITAYCSGYWPKCPDYVKKAANI